MKSLCLKLLALVLAGILTVGVYGIGVFRDITADKQGEQEVVLDSMPTISNTYGVFQGTSWNGYTNPISVVTLRTGLIPLGDYELQLQLDSKGNQISAMNWQIRSIDGTRLIHQEKITSWTGTGSDMQTTLSLPGILETNTEYTIQLQLDLKDGGSCYYYNRFVIAPTTPYEEQIKFVKEFHDATLGLGDSGIISQYIDPSDEDDNSNLGFVTLHASKDQVMWSLLAPQRIGEPTLTVVDFNDEYLGSYRLDYKVKAMDDNDQETLYHVSEVYRVRLDEEGFTLVDYGRKTTELFGMSLNSATTNGILLGIRPNSEVTSITNEEKTVAMFEANGNLWHYTNEGELSLVLSYEEQREDHEYHFFFMDENGVCYFMNYGIQPKGAHYGQMGVSLCKYDPEKQQVEEVVFLSYDKSFDYLKEGMKEVAYAGDQTFYILIDENLYCIDYSGSEAVVVAEGLKKEDYVLNKEGNMIAWNMPEDSLVGSRIKLVNMKTGENTMITGEQGTCVKAVGFVGEDFVYSVIDTNLISANWYGEETYGATELVIIGSNMEKLRSYCKEGMFFTGIALSDGMLSLQCSERNADGTFTFVEDDYIINQNVKEAVTLEVYSRTSVKEEKEWGLEFSSAGLLAEKKTAEYHSRATTIPMQGSLEATPGYYVYGEWGYAGHYEAFGEAVNRAYDVQGYVIDEAGTYLFKRKTVQNWRQLHGMTVQELQSFLKLYENGKGMDLSGASLSRALSFFGSGEYWLYAGIGNEWVFMNEFDSTYVVYMDVETGKTTTMLREEMEALMEQEGNHYLIIPR